MRTDFETDVDEVLVECRVNEEEETDDAEDENPEELQLSNEVDEMADWTKSGECSGSHSSGNLQDYKQYFP